MMGTEIFKIDASWAEKLTKTRVSFLTAPTVVSSQIIDGALEVFIFLFNFLTSIFKIDAS